MSTLSLVGVTPIRLAPGREHPLEVYNNGTAGIIYVSRNPSVSPTQYDYSLSPNGKASVIPGVELYVCTDANSNARMFYHSDGTAVDLGLIVSVPSSPSDSLVNSSISLASLGATTVLLDTSTLNAYQSLVIKVGDVTTFSGVDTLQNARLYVQWYSGTILVKELSPHFLLTGSIEYHVNVIAPRVVISIVNNSSGAALNRQVNIIGLAALVPHYYKQFPGNTSQFVNCNDVGSIQNVNAKLVQLLVNIVVGVTGYVYPESLAGECSFSGSTNGSGVTNLLLFVATYNAPNDNNAVRLPYPSPMVGATNDRRYANDKIILPELPLLVKFGVTGAGLATGSANFSWK